MATGENMRISVPTSLKADWDAMIAARGISQQRAVVALMGWIVKQDPLLQLMLFGQAPAGDQAELARIVLDRLAASGKGKGGGRKRAG